MISSTKSNPEIFCSITPWFRDSLTLKLGLYVMKTSYSSLLQMIYVGTDGLLSVITQQVREQTRKSIFPYHAPPDRQSKIAISFPQRIHPSMIVFS
jgi:hypothetical protein